MSFLKLLAFAEDSQMTFHFLFQTVKELMGQILSKTELKDGEKL